MNERGGQRRLGRGLEALLGPSREDAEREGALLDVAITAVSPNPFQPRRSIDETELEELAHSIRVSGLLQPVVVRPKGDGRYDLIAGERRLRAVERLGWPSVPAVVRDVDDATMLTLALVENLQRNALSPIDEALGFRRLVEEFHVSHQELAESLGRDRSTVANSLRLLKLPPAVQVLVNDGALSVGHARALLGLEDPDVMVRLAGEAVSRGWSVREMEARTRRGRPRQRGARLGRRARAASAEQRRVEDALRRRLQTDVRVVAHGERGRVEITFYSADDLARVLELILGEPFS